MGSDNDKGVIEEFITATGLIIYITVYSLIVRPIQIAMTVITSPIVQVYRNYQNRKAMRDYSVENE